MLGDAEPAEHGVGVNRTERPMMVRTNDQRHSPHSSRRRTRAGRADRPAGQGVVLATDATAILTGLNMFRDHY